MESRVTSTIPAGPDGDARAADGPGLRALAGLLGAVLPPVLELVDLVGFHRLWCLADGEPSDGAIASAPWTVTMPHPRRPTALTEQGTDFLAWSDQRYRIRLTGVLAGTSIAEQRAVAAGLRLLGRAIDCGGTTRVEESMDERPDSGVDPLAEAVDATVVASRALLGMVARSVSSALEMVTLPQFRVMVVLAAEGPLRVTTLARRMGAVPSTFSRTLDRMVAAGWLKRTENPDSRREVLVHLTDQGRRLVDEVTTRRRAEIRAALERLSPEARAEVTAALGAFGEAAGEPTVEDLLVLGL